MTTMEIDKELVALFRHGKNQEAIDRLYSPNIESVEAVAMPGMGQQTQKGIQAIKGRINSGSTIIRSMKARLKGPIHTATVSSYVLSMTLRLNTTGNA
jgi:hypothetical protein